MSFVAPCESHHVFAERSFMAAHESRHVLLKGHSLQPVSHVTFLLKGQSEGRPGPSSTFSSLLSQKIADWNSWRLLRQWREWRIACRLSNWSSPAWMGELIPTAINCFAINGFSLLCSSIYINVDLLGNIGLPHLALSNTQTGCWIPCTGSKCFKWQLSDDLLAPLAVL